MLKGWKSTAVRYIAGFGIVIAALWLLIAASLRSIESEAIDRAGITARTLARSLAEEVASNTWTIDFALRQFRDNWIRSPQSFPARMEKEREFLVPRSISRIEIADSRGVIIYDSSNVAAPRMDASAGEHIEQHRAQGGDQLFISKPGLDPIWNRRVICFSRPLYDKRGKLAGAIMLSVPSESMQQSYESILLPGGADISLVRADGQFLASSSEHLERMLATPLDPASTPGLRPGDPASGISRRISNVSKVESLFAYNTVRGYPLMIHIRQPCRLLCRALAQHHRAGFRRWTELESHLCP